MRNRRVSGGGSGGANGRVDMLARFSLRRVLRLHCRNSVDSQKPNNDTEASVTAAEHGSSRKSSSTSSSSSCPLGAGASAPHTSVDVPCGSGVGRECVVCMEHIVENDVDDNNIEAGGGVAAADNEVGVGDRRFVRLSQCGHASCCRQCLRRYVRGEILEMRPRVSCPLCPQRLHPSEIYSIVDDALVMERYEAMMVRLALATEADARWCPMPDCGYVVIASGCASCPRLSCGRTVCGGTFCYHCQAAWHADVTCARAARPTASSSSSSRHQRRRPGRAAPGGGGPSSSLPSSYRVSDDSDSVRASASSSGSSCSEVKNCPRCQIAIAKMDDGSCNHMTCGFCGAEFCWLCMQEISDLHYLSPSGCTFWGKKPWSRKKKIIWQLGTLVGAPIIATLMAGVALPAVVIGLPIWVGKKLYHRYRECSNARLHVIVLGGVLSASVVSPVLAVLTVGVGVPVLLAYIYGVIPVSLYRAGTSAAAMTTATGDSSSLATASLRLGGAVRLHIDNSTTPQQPTHPASKHDASVEAVVDVSNNDL